MDRIPCGNLPEYGGRTVDDRIGMIVELVERGYGDRIVVSHDDPIWAGLLTAEDQARHLDANPDGIAFIHRRVLPALARSRPRRRGDPPDHGRQPGPLAGRRRPAGVRRRVRVT